MPFVQRAAPLRARWRIRVWDTWETESCRHIDQIREGVGLHLSHHLAAMCFDRNFADVELATHLFIQEARDYQPHDLPFARGERRVTVSKRPHLRVPSKSSAAALDGLPDGA